MRVRHLHAKTRNRLFSTGLFLIGLSMIAGFLPATMQPVPAEVSRTLTSDPAGANPERHGASQETIHRTGPRTAQAAARMAADCPDQTG